MAILARPAELRADAAVRHEWRRFAAALAALLLVALATLQLRPSYDYAVDLREPAPATPFELTGIHQVESLAGTPYRWTTDYPFLQLRHAFHLAPSFRVSLTIRSDRPDGPAPVTFRVNEQPLATVQPTRELRTYSLLIPRRPDDDGSLRFAAATDNLTTAGDPRRLGFITTAWSLVPQFMEPRLGPLTPGEATLVILGGLLLFGWLSWRTGVRTALVVSGFATAILLALRQFYQPSPIPFPHLVGIALLAVLAASLLTRQALPLLTLSVLSLVVTFSGALWPSWMTDDALISFRYAQNLYAGNGLVYNVDERVEGYTNFLWTMLAALVFLLSGEPVHVSYYAGVVVALLVVGVTYVLARRYLHPGWALAAAALLATNHSLLLYTARGSGLETGLFALLLVVGSDFTLRGRWATAGAVFALATMTRPEGVLLLGLAILLRLVERRRLDGAIWRMAGAFALIGVPFFAWRFAYYGDLLPNTFYAKTGGGLTQALRGLGYAGSFALFAGGPILGFLLGLAALALWTPGSGPAERRWQRFTFAVVALFTAYVIAVGGDHFPGYRFFTPILPFIALLLAAGARELSTLVGGPLRPLARPIAALLVVGLSIFNLTRSASFDRIVQGDDESVWIWRELGWWLGDHGGSGASMAAMGAGAIPYYSNHPTVDLLGLNDKHIARLEVEEMGAGVAGHEKRDPEYVLDVRKPTYIPAMWADYFGGEPALKRTGLYREAEIVTRYGRRLRVWKRIQ